VSGAAPPSAAFLAISMIGSWYAGDGYIQEKREEWAVVVEIRVYDRGGG